MCGSPRNFQEFPAICRMRSACLRLAHCRRLQDGLAIGQGLGLLAADLSHVSELRGGTDAWHRQGLPLE